MRLTVKELLEATDGTLLSGDEGTVIRHVSIDSREIPEDCLFVPIRGETNDGHDYIEKALTAGALATLTSEREAFDYFEENHEEHQKCFLLVDDTERALQASGRAARKRVKATAVGITGSVGKTTTREMIARTLSAGQNVFKTAKNYNNRLGVPLTLTELPEEADFAVLELGRLLRNDETDRRTGRSAGKCGGTGHPFSHGGRGDVSEAPETPRGRAALDLRPRRAS